MGRPLKTAKSATKDTGFAWNDTYNIGVVGGDTSLAGAQINVRVKVGANAEAEGFIIRQKGSRKFLVEDASANQGVCTVVNENDASLGANEMTITAIKPDSSTVRLERITNRYGIDFSGNRFLLSFTDIVASTVVKAGTVSDTIDVVQIDNDETYEE